MGSFLSEKYSDDYGSIALTTGGGTYTANLEKNGKWYKSELTEPYAGTWENIFAALKYENFLLFLDKNDKEKLFFPFL